MIFEACNISKKMGKTLEQTFFKGKLIKVQQGELDVDAEILSWVNVLSL
jgi:hypothetical protein